MCWFDLLKNMWGFLATSHASLTANDNLENEPYFCLDLLANLEDLLRPIDPISTILGFFDMFSPSLYCIPLGALDNC